MSVRMIAFAVVATVAAVWARPVEAGRQTVCLQPEAFSGAAVNTAVLQYLYDGPAGKRLSATAQRLSRLIQLDTLLSLLKHESIGVLHLEIPPGSESQCPAARVTEMLLGRRPGGQPVSPGHALVLVGGRMYEEQGQIYVQSRLEFRRRDRPEELRLTVPDAAGRAITFTAGLPSQTIAFPPRRLTADDLKKIEANFAAAAVVRPHPSDTVPGKPLDVPSLEEFAYWVTDTKPGGWMKIQSQGSGPSGWVRAQIDPGLRARMPELLLVDGLVGYLRYRMDREGPRVGLPAQPPALVRDTLAQYLKREASNTASEPVALAHSLDATLRILETGPADRVTVPVEARQGLTRVTALIPYNPGAWGLRAIADVQACCGPGGTTARWEEVANTFLKALAAGPRDAVALANLEALYVLLSATPPSTPIAAAEIQRRLQEVRAVRAAIRGR
jgi:hypothetical protein